MTIDDDQLQTAYRKLKQLVYYDKTDLKLRCRLAEFECDPEFEKKLAIVQTVVNSEGPLNNRSFKRWLKEIGFRIVPKQIETSDSKIDDATSTNGRFISNVTSAKTFNVTKVNYFFDGPIELHLIAVLWIMRDGWLLDAQLGPECCGSRLVAGLNNPEDRSAGLFRKYHEQYARWRDSGIRKAKQLLAEDRINVAILGLDVQEYFYRIRLDVPSITRAVNKAHREQGNGSNATESNNLLECLESIHVAYRECIAPFLQLTHMDISPKDMGIPIGLCSSLLLANWYLKEFDDAIRTSVRPVYYGRYVDDILLVIATHEDPSQDERDPVGTFIDDVLVNSRVLRKVQGGRYEIAQPRALFLQQKKCILQFFDADHSIAGLEKFQKKLEENGSDFLLMPVDEADNSLEDVAYELLYEGSVNKFRSVKGLAENRYELAKHLARQTILHLLTDDPPDYKVGLGLRKFFKGRSAIEFHDLWERVFTFFLIANDPKAANAFEKTLLTEINRVKFNGEQEISKRLSSDLNTHLELSREMASALGNCESLQFDDDATEVKGVFRRSNLMRHHFVRKPLLNYTNYQGALTSRIVDGVVKTDRRMLELSPRYVNFDECLLLAESGNVRRDKLPPFQWASKLYEVINRCAVEGVAWDTVAEREEKSDG